MVLVRVQKSRWRGKLTGSKRRSLGAEPCELEHAVMFFGIMHRRAKDMYMRLDEMQYWQDETVRCVRVP